MHEAQMHESNCFVTFTYSEENLPSDLSLRHRDFQLFMKRLRKHVDVRFYMCGEYGSRYSRPHYHACLFGFSPVDRVFYKTTPAGYNIYTSKYLDGLWRLGFCNFGDVTFESAGYVARYVMKKVGSDGDFREIFDPTTGEIFLREHEYSRMSLKPGIGATWYSKFLSDVYPHDRVIVRGKKCKPPKYYDVLLDRLNPLYLASLKAARVAAAGVHFEDSFPKRLRVREVVTNAAIRSLKRS